MRQQQQVVILYVDQPLEGVDLLCQGSLQIIPLLSATLGFRNLGFSCRFCRRMCSGGGAQIFLPVFFSLFLSITSGFLSKSSCPSTTSTNSLFQSPFLAQPVPVYSQALFPAFPPPQTPCPLCIVVRQLSPSLCCLEVGRRGREEQGSTKTTGECLPALNSSAQHLRSSQHPGAAVAGKVLLSPRVDQSMQKESSEFSCQAKISIELS